MSIEPGTARFPPSFLSDFCVVLLYIVKAQIYAGCLRVGFNSNKKKSRKFNRRQLCLGYNSQTAGKFPMLPNCSLQRKITFAQSSSELLLSIRARSLLLNGRLIVTRSLLFCQTLSVYDSPLPGLIFPLILYTMARKKYGKQYGALYYG